MANDLTFSFVGGKAGGLPEDDSEAAPTGDLNLSFVGGRVSPLEQLPEEVRALRSGSPADAAAAISARQAAGGFPQGKRPDFDIWDIKSYPQVVSRAWSGEDRETRATRELPSLAEVGITRFLGEERFASLSEKVGGTAKAMALLTAFRPSEQVQILSEATNGEIGVQSDEAGNIILSMDGRQVILNDPGMSKMDTMQLGATMAAFSPVNKLGRGASLTGNALKVGAGSATIQALLEGFQKTQGGEVNASDVLLAGGAGAGLQFVMQGVAQRMLPFLARQVKDGKITNAIRSQFRRAAVEAGHSADDVTDDLIYSALGTADDRSTPYSRLSMQGERDFGIPLTEGQRSGNVNVLSVEDSMRHGSRGVSARNTMIDFADSRQKPAVRIAQDKIEQTIGPSVESPGAVVRRGVLDLEAAAKTKVDDAYKLPDAALTPEGFSGLLQSIRKSMRSLAYDKSLPETAKTLGLVNDAMKMVSTFKGKGLRPVDMKQISVWKVRLNNAIKAADNPADAAQMRVIKNQFDDYLHDAVENALFTGDKSAIAALKSADSIFRGYAKLYRQNPVRGPGGKVVDADPAGKFIERMIRANPTDDEIVESIFGATGIKKTAGVAFARRFKSILGEKSEGWGAIRREGLRRIFVTGKGDDVISARRSLEQLEKGGDMLKELYSPDEIKLFKRFLVHLKRAQPAPDNPSGSGHKIGQNIDAWAKRIAIMMGDPGGIVVSHASGGVTAVRNAAKAQAAIRPFSTIKELNAAVVPAGVAVTSKAKNN